MTMTNPNRVLPGMKDMPDDFIHPHAEFHLCKNKRPVAAHLLGVTFHHLQIRANRLREIGFVDDQQV